MKRIFIFLTFFVFFSHSLLANSFSMNTIDGKNIVCQKIGDSKLTFPSLNEDSPTLIFFFGLNCPNCEKDWKKIQKAVYNGKVFNFIGIQASDPNLTDDKLRLYARQRGMKNVVNANEAYPLIKFLSEQGKWTKTLPYIIGFDNKGTLFVKGNK